MSLHYDLKNREGSNFCSQKLGCKIRYFLYFLVELLPFSGLGAWALETVQRMVGRNQNLHHTSEHPRHQRTKLLYHRLCIYYWLDTVQLFAYQSGHISDKRDSSHYEIRDDESCVLLGKVLVRERDIFFIQKQGWFFLGNLIPRNQWWKFFRKFYRFFEPW